MKGLNKVGLFLVVLLLVASCTVEKRVHRKGYHVTYHQLSKSKNAVNEQILQDADIDSVVSYHEAIKDSINYLVAKTVVNVSEVPVASLSLKNQSITTFFKPFRIISKSQKEDRSLKKEEKAKGESPVQNSKRKAALYIGWGLILMAVLAGISVPVLGSVTASVGWVGIFLLDIVVALGIFKYHRDENLKLSWITGGLRLIYTVILGLAVGFHIGGNVAMFSFIWGIGLITFGAHLIVLGVLFNNKKGKKWLNTLIKVLLITAGIGYMLQYIGILIVANPVAFTALVEPIFIIPMILGELMYAFWMLIKGGK